MNMDLGAGLRKALAKLTGAAIIDERAVKEFVKELQRILISNDVNVKLVFELSKRIEEKALREKPLPGVLPKEHVVRVVSPDFDCQTATIKAEFKLQKIMLILNYGESTGVGAKPTLVFQY